MEFLDEALIGPLSDFVKNSRMLIRKCQKPNYNEFNNIAFTTFMGFIIMGFIGFFIKLIFIPINNVILGS